MNYLSRISIKRVSAFSSYNGTHKYLSSRSLHSERKQCDVIVIGGGIAGTSVGYELQNNHNLNVTILEQEYYPGYHSTGRAAGLFSENYGTNAVKLLSIASRKWFENPPLNCHNNIKEDSILTPGGALLVSAPEYQDIMISTATNTPCDGIFVISKQKALELSPLLADDDELMGDQCVWEPSATNLNIGLVHQSYLRGCKHNNIDILCNEKVDMINKCNESNMNWEIITNVGTENEKVYESRLIINAAGPWADDVAMKAGLNKLNIKPLRRCIVTFKPHNDEIQQILNRHIDDTDNYTHPFVFGSDENGKEFWYIAPQSKSGLFLCSPANRDEDEPCDAQPSDLEIALAVDRIETYTKCEIKKIEAKWAGLRCHSNDYNFVIGVDPNDKTNSFYWCAALAGQGIQAAPGYSQLLANIVCDKGIPSHIEDIGLQIDDIAPDRLLKPKQDILE